MPLTDTIGSIFPSGQGGGGLAISVITWIVLIIVFAAIAGAATYFIIIKLRYSKKLVIFEKVGKTIEPTRKDKAMLLKWGEGGDNVFFTQKTKKYLPVPTIQTGKNIYWYYIREDGEWINFGIEDIDQKMKELHAHYLDKEMRYARVALQRNLQERYQKVTFWDKYGGFIVYTSMIMIICIGIWLLFDKWLKVSGALTEAIKAAKEVLAEAGRVLGTVDNLKSSGSVQPAG